MKNAKDSLEHEVIDGVHVLRVKMPRLDDESALLVVEDELTELLDEPGGEAPKVVINLASVEYMFTAALAKLVSYRAKILERSGQISLCCLRDGVAGVMKIMHFDRLFDICKSERDARAQLQ